MSGWGRKTTEPEKAGSRRMSKRTGRDAAPSRGLSSRGVSSRKKGGTKDADTQTGPMNPVDRGVQALIRPPTREKGVEAKNVSVRDVGSQTSAIGDVAFRVEVSKVLFSQDLFREVELRKPKRPSGGDLLMDGSDSDSMDDGGGTNTRQKSLESDDVENVETYQETAEDSTLKEDEEEEDGEKKSPREDSVDGGKEEESVVVEKVLERYARRRLIVQNEVRTSFTVEDEEDGNGVVTRFQLKVHEMGDEEWDSLRETAANFGLRLGRIATAEATEGEALALLLEASEDSKDGLADVRIVDDAKRRGEHINDVISKEGEGPIKPKSESSSTSSDQHARTLDQRALEREVEGEGAVVIPEYSPSTHEPLRCCGDTVRVLATVTVERRPTTSKLVEDDEEEEEEEEEETGGNSKKKRIRDEENETASSWTRGAHAQPTVPEEELEHMGRDKTAADPMLFSEETGGEWAGLLGGDHVVGAASFVPVDVHVLALKVDLTLLHQDPAVQAWKARLVHVMASGARRAIRMASGGGRNQPEGNDDQEENEEDGIDSEVLIDKVHADIRDNNPVPLSAALSEVSVETARRHMIRRLKEQRVFFLEDSNVRSGNITTMALSFDNLLHECRQPRIIRAAVEFLENLGVRQNAKRGTIARAIPLRPHEQTAARMLGVGKFSDWVVLAKQQLRMPKATIGPNAVAADRAARILRAVTPLSGGGGRRSRGREVAETVPVVLTLRMRFRRSRFERKRAERIRDGRAKTRGRRLPEAMVRGWGSTHTLTRFELTGQHAETGEEMLRAQLSYAELLASQKYGIADLADGVIAAFELAEADEHEHTLSSIEAIEHAAAATEEGEEGGVVQVIVPPSLDLGSRDEAARRVQVAVRQWMVRKRARAVREIAALVARGGGARQELLRAESDSLPPATIRQWLTGTSPWTTGGRVSRAIAANRRAVGRSGRVWVDPGTGEQQVQHPSDPTEPYAIEVTRPPRSVHVDLNLLLEEQAALRALAEAVTSERFTPGEGASLSHARPFQGRLAAGSLVDEAFGIPSGSERGKRAPLVRYFIRYARARAKLRAQTLGVDSETIRDAEDALRDLERAIRETAADIRGLRIHVDPEAPMPLDASGADSRPGTSASRYSTSRPGTSRTRPGTAATEATAARDFQPLPISPVHFMPVRPVDWLSFLLDTPTYEATQTQWQAYAEARMEPPPTPPLFNVPGSTLYDAPPELVPLTSHEQGLADTRRRREAERRTPAEMEQSRRLARQRASVEGMSATLPDISTAGEALARSRTGGRVRTPEEGATRPGSALDLVLQEPAEWLVGDARRPKTPSYSHAIRYTSQASQTPSVGVTAMLPGAGTRRGAAAAKHLPPTAEGFAKMMAKRLGSPMRSRPIGVHHEPGKEQVEAAIANRETEERVVRRPMKQRQQQTNGSQRGRPTLQSYGMTVGVNAPPGAYSLVEGAASRGALSAQHGRTLAAQYAMGESGVERRRAALLQNKTSHRATSSFATSEHETAFAASEAAARGKARDAMGYSGAWAVHPQ